MTHFNFYYSLPETLDQVLILFTCGVTLCGTRHWPTITIFIEFRGTETINCRKGELNQPESFVANGGCLINRIKSRD